MSDFKAKMHQIRFRLGIRPRPRWGAYSAFPDPLPGFRGPTSKGEGRDRPPCFAEMTPLLHVRPKKVKCASPCQMWGGGLDAPGSDTILVFSYQRGCRYSDGNALTGASNARGYDKMTIFFTNISLSDKRL